MIITRKRRDQFAVIPNEVANDERLTFEARGLLCYLLAKPNDWNVNLNDIRRAGNIGKHKAYAILNELIVNGYIERKVNKDSRNRITSHDYIVYDASLIQTLPFPENREVEKPLPENQDMDPKNREQGQNKSPLPDFPEADEPEAENQDTYKKLIQTKDFDDIAFGFWNDWPEKHKAPNREAVIKQLAKEKVDVLPHIVDFAKTWRMRQLGLNNPPLMSAYLKTRGWEEMRGAPEFEPDGMFRITPARDEWQPWKSYTLKKYGAAGVKQLETRGYVFTKTRWPEGMGGHPA